jgi:transposase
MQLDQAGAHKAKRLKLPANILLLFQPSHAPETNPIERVWQHFKLGLRGQWPKDLDELRLWAGILFSTRYLYVASI